MYDPFQALAVFAGVDVPVADTTALRERARALRAMAEEIDDLARSTATAVAEVRRKNDSRSVERLADVWPKELAPRYTAVSKGLKEVADGCDEYAKVVDEHREQLWAIGTQLAAMAFTMTFCYLYPGAAKMGEAAMKALIRRAQLQKTWFQKTVQWILTRRIRGFPIGNHLVTELADAVADSIVWTAAKTTVHVASSAATGQPIGSLPEYAARHFAAEMAYNFGIKGMRDTGRLAGASKLPTGYAERLLGDGPGGKFFRRTFAAGTLYAMVAGGMSWEAAVRAGLAHAPRAFILEPHRAARRGRGVNP
jgi:hypothetical protein